MKSLTIVTSLLFVVLMSIAVVSGAGFNASVGDGLQTGYGVGGQYNATVLVSASPTGFASGGGYGAVVGFFGAGGSNESLGNATPMLTIISPIATTYSDYIVPLDYVVNSSSDACWYALNGVNTSLHGCVNTTLDAAQGVNNVTVFVNDSANDTSNATVLFTVTSAITSSGGSGGGGGGGGAPTTSAESVAGTIETSDVHNFGYLYAGQNVSYDTTSDMFITHVYLHFTGEEDEVSLNIMQFLTKPDDLDAVPDAITYKYFYVEHQGMDLTDVRTLTFKVPDAWLGTVHATPQDVMFFRLENDTWTPYAPQFAGLVDGNDTYTVSLPGFSYFAIGVRQMVAAGTPAGSAVAPSQSVSQVATNGTTSPSAPSGSEQQSPSSTPLSSTKSKSPILLSILMAAVVAVLGVLGYHQYQRYQKSGLKEHRDLNTQRKNLEVRSEAHGAENTNLMNHHVDAAAVVTRGPEHDPAHAVNQYIIRMRERGATEDEIKKELLRAGWDDLVVDLELMRKN